MIKYGLDDSKHYVNKKGYGFKVIDFKSWDKILVEFDSGYKNYFVSEHVKSGSIKDKMSPDLFGVGFNDSDYDVETVVDGVRKCCPYYKKWSAMISRCYSEKVQQKRPKYKGCTVDERWHKFSNFKRWMKQQDWKGKELDKDILDPNNKVYSEDKCIFVSHRINTLVISGRSKKSTYPRGVSFVKRNRKFDAKCITIDGKYKFIGYYDTAEEARSEYCKFKAKIIKDISVDCEPRLKEALNKHIEILELDII